MGKGGGHPDDIGQLEKEARDQILAPLPRFKCLETSLKQQKQPNRGLFLLGHSVCGLDHRPRCYHRVEIRPESRKRLDDGDLCDGVEIAALVENQVNMGEMFEPTTKPALCLAHTFGNRPDLAVVGAEENHDTVSLSEWVGPQNYRLIVTDCHEIAQSIERWA